MNEDIRVFSPDNLLAQAASATPAQGYLTVEFYVDEQGQIAKTPTEQIGKFYLSPSGGTLRDKDMNIVQYSAKYDKFKGYGKKRT